MRPQATGSNPLSGSIIYVHLVVRGHFAISVFVLISGVGVQRHGAFIPTLGSEEPQWVPAKLIFMSVRISIPLSLCPSVSLSLCSVARVAFWRSNRAARNCTQCMRPQATGSNTLSGSIICLSFLMSGYMQAFCNFCICINFQCRCPASQCIYPHTGVRRTPVGSSQDYMYIHFSLYMSVSLSVCPVVRVTFWRS